MSFEDFQYTEISKKIIGAAMKVHAYFGMGFPEIIYCRALRLEFQNGGLDFQAEVEKDIYYKGIFIGKRKLDLLVEGKILVECRAVREVEKSSFNQVLNYLKIFGLEVGLLLNFGAESVYFKRFGFSGSNLRNPSNP